MTKEELKPIDVSKYTVTESGNVIKGEEKKTTKEELENEAMRRVDAFIDTLSQDVRSTLYDRLNQEDVKDFLYGVYIDSAEPREKRIAELEEKNAEAKDIIEDFITKIPASLVEHFESEKERAEKFLGWK